MFDVFLIANENFEKEIAIVKFCDLSDFFKSVY